MSPDAFPRPILLLLSVVVVLSGTSAAFSIAAFRAVQSNATSGSALPAEPAAELAPAVRSPSTRPQDTSGKHTSSPSTTIPTDAPAPTVTAPAVADAGNLVLGQDATRPSPTWTRPELLETRADPNYGLAITRMTSADGTRFNRNTYSRRQAENADGSAFLTYHGDANYNVYDVATADLIAITPVHPDGDPQWHPTDPDKIRHVAGKNSSAGTLELLETTVSTGTTVVLADLTSRVQTTFPTALYMSDRSEGSPSADGNRYAWIVYDDNEDPIAIISYDLEADKIAGSIPVAPSEPWLIDWASASPSGDYVMASLEDGTYAWDFDMTNKRLVFDGSEHSDIAVGPTGNDTYVYIDFTASQNGGWIVAVNLVTGETRRYVDLYDDANTSIHFSGKGYDAPGWIVASTYNCKESFAWSCEKVFALNLADGTIVNLAHTYNCGDDYWTETHAVVNRSLTRVYFNSDAGSCGTNAEVYRIDLPKLS